MNSAKTLSGKYSAMPFFRFTLRQNLRHFALYLVIVALVMIIPAFMALQSDYSLLGYAYTSWDIMSVVAMTTVVSGFAVSGLFAVISGMSTASYLNSKQGTVCYHSFPVRREKLLLSEVLTKLVYSVASLALGYTLPILLCYVSLPLPIQTEDNFFATYCKMALIALFVYLLVYSVFLFASSITGTGVVRFLMVAVIFVAPGALYALLVAMAKVGCENLYVDYYFNDTTLLLLFSPMRLVQGAVALVEDNKWGLFLSILADVTLFTGAAFYLNGKRKSEASGTSIVWKPVMQVVQIVVIVGCTLFGAWFFHELIGVNTPQSFLFGGATGAVLSFIISNCILYRSSRAMFKGLKGFGVLCAVIAVFFLLVPMNVFGLVGDFYPVWNTASLEITPIGMDTPITYTDKEDVKELLTLMTDDGTRYSHIEYLQMPYLVTDDDDPYSDVDEDYVWNSERNKEKYYYKEYSSESGEMIQIELESAFNRGTYSPRQGNILVIQKPKFGIPLAIHVGADVRSSLTETIYESDEYIQTMNVAEWLDAGKIYSMTFCLDQRQLNIHNTKGNFSFEDPYAALYEKAGSAMKPEMWDLCLAVIGGYDYEAEASANATVIGSIEISYRTESASILEPYEIHSIYLPVYDTSLDRINSMESLMITAKYWCGYKPGEFSPYKTVETYYHRAEEHCYDNYFILLVDLRTGEKRALSNQEFVDLADKTTSFLMDNTYDLRCITRESQLPYAILYQCAKNDDIVLRFREGAITEEKLAEIFAGK